jgi:hypothetical protein
MSEEYKMMDSRVKTVEDAVRLLTQMAIRDDERIDGFDSRLSNLTLKIEALADAQIRTEEAHTRLENAHTRLEEAHTRLENAHTRLAETQSRSDQRLDALIDIVREDREDRKGL